MWPALFFLGLFAFYRALRLADRSLKVWSNQRKRLIALWLAIAVCGFAGGFLDQPQYPDFIVSVLNGIWIFLMVFIPCGVASINNSKLILVLRNILFLAISGVNFYFAYISL